MKFASLILVITLSVGLTPIPAETIPSRDTETYPAAASKKGLQVETVEDALALGVKHAALNFNLAQLIDPQNGTNNPGWAQAAVITSCVAISLPWITRSRPYRTAAWS